MPPKKFVFYDNEKQRWNKLKMAFRKFLLIASFIAILFVFSVFYVPRFGNSIFIEFRQTPKSFIDFVSSLEEEVIRVSGYGPLLSLESGMDGTPLVRKDFQKEKTAILSFDDGPDPVYTPQILEVLEKENVKAVFFAIGEQLLRYPQMAQTIVEAGHQLGTHTFIHPAEEVDLYSQQERISVELDFPQKVIQAQTGYKTSLFRLPHWGVEDTISLNTLILASYAMDRGYTVVSSTKDSFDWKERDPQKVARNSVDLGSSQIILMHDGGGDRSATVESLPEIIRRYKESGFQFTTADALLPDGVSAMTKANLLDRFTSQIAVFVYLFKANFNNLLTGLFRLTLVLIGTSITITLVLAFVHVLSSSKRKDGGVVKPFISVIVPAYNEEKTIGRTIESLLNSDYPRFEIVVVDNNSQDKTAEVIKKYLDRKKVRLVKEKVQGKYAALNKGIRSAKGAIIMVIDADTQVLPKTIERIVQPFKDKQVGGVAGNLKVGNLVNPLTVFQSIEYTVGLNLDRRAYDVLHAIQVAPGALAAWRRKLVKKVGSYQGDTLTEDSDLTVRIQKAGFNVTFAPEAVAYTEAPEDIGQFLRQRLRWTLGTLQVLFKYRSMFFRTKYGFLGMFVLPYLALVQLPLLLLSPFVDLFALVILIYIPGLVVSAFVIFLMLYYVLSITAFAFAREKKIWLLAFLPISRIFYQSILYYVLYRSVLVAIKGVYVPWRKLVHNGRFIVEEDGKKISLLPRLFVTDN